MLSTAMLRVVIHVVLFAALLAVASQKSTPQSDREKWIALTERFSRYPCDPDKACDGDARRIAVRSPDGRKIFAVRPGRGGKPIITITANGKRVHHDVRYMSQPHLLWSPASNGFLIESTEGGSYAGWAVQAFMLSSNRVEEFDVSTEARKDLARAFPQCIPGDKRNVDCDWSDWSDHFNVFALKWLSGDRLLLTVEVPCSTGYGPNWCKQKVYEVEVPSGRILTAYTQAEAHKRYPTLVGAETQ